jgi:two-component system phosphate regulon sensor histidine kinase PhoR
MNEKYLVDAILSALGEGVVATDHTGRILFLNSAAERLFEASSDAVKGKPFLEGLRFSSLLEVLSLALAQRQAVEREVTLFNPAERVLSVHARPFEFGEEHPGILMAIRDITEIRRLSNLRQEFVANVTHELKTTLTSIKGYIETLLDGAINDTKHNREFLETIQEHTNNLGRLIDDVLDLSAIEAQRVAYRMEAVSLPDIIDRILKALDPMAKAKKVIVEVDFPVQVPKVRADRDKLTQILMNLIDNAIKFNKQGGRVRVTASPNDKELFVRVEDTGAGIASEDLPRVFERFYRGNKDRSHEIPGTGLGLAIVKHLVEAHQGTLRAESTLGQGSVFLFTLPLA